MAKNCPSSAQAKFLARLWAQGRATGVNTTPDGWVDPTTNACVNRGWLVPNGKTSHTGNGTPQADHVVSDDGLDAIETYFREARYKRQEAIHALRSALSSS